MSTKNQGMLNRWFITVPLYMLANGEEIRQAARKAGARLVDAQFKTEHDVEAPGKPTEVLLDRYKKQDGSSDSNHPAPTSTEGQEPLVKMAEQRLTEVHAAQFAEAQAKAEDESSKAQVAVDNAAQAAVDTAKAANDAKAAKEAEAAKKVATAAQTAAAEKAAAAAKASAEKAAADAAAKSAAAKAEAEANKTIEAKAEVAEKAVK